MAPNNELDMGTRGGETMAMKMLTATPAPPLHALKCLRELSVDTNSFGALVAVLLVNMKDNTSIEILTITFTASAILPNISKCLRNMAPNSNLKELRLFGSPLGYLAIEGLADAIYNGLRGLRHLEFSAASNDPIAAAASERIINIAKSRLYAGRLSLSVSVN